MDALNKARAVLSASDKETHSQFSVYMADMVSRGLQDMKFCVSGSSSVEPILRQIMAVEALYDAGLTKKYSDDLE